MLNTDILFYNEYLVDANRVRINTSSNSVFDEVASIEYYAALDNPVNVLG